MQMNQVTKSRPLQKTKLVTSLLFPYPTKAHVVLTQRFIHATSLSNITEEMKTPFLGFPRLFNCPLSHYGVKKPQKAGCIIVTLAIVSGDPVISSQIGRTYEVY